MPFRMSFEQWKSEVALNFAGMTNGEELPEDDLQEMYRDGLSPFTAAQYAADRYGEQKMDAYADELSDWFETARYSIFNALLGEPEDYQ